MKPSFDAILDIVCEPISSEERAAKLLTLVEKTKKPAKKRESFDSEQHRRVRSAMTPGVWYDLADITSKAGYPPNSIAAVSARLREMPDVESRKLGRYYQYRIRQEIDAKI